MGGFRGLGPLTTIATIFNYMYNKIKQKLRFSPPFARFHWCQEIAAY
jgi:hypothetical protein